MKGFGNDSTGAMQNCRASLPNPKNGVLVLMHAIRSVPYSSIPSSLALNLSHLGASNAQHLLHLALQLFISFEMLDASSKIRITIGMPTLPPRNPR